jgi:hypothetical protein
MASTYTSELRIEKIATGEQSGTWGTTTNTQYDNWEASISGTVTVAWATDADDALTTANGTDDEARHMFLDFTGGATLTATRNMVVPSSSKLYFVSNQTTGGQSIVIKTAAGTGITVPTTKFMALYCDGTNVIDAMDYVNITGGTITGITDLVVADGGTGVSTLTDGGVLLGSGTGAITAMAVLADGEMIVGDGTTDPVAESGATLRTSIGVGTGDSPQFTGIELGHASDSTITRVSAGLLAIEGSNIVTASLTSSETVAGVVELATAAEVVTGSDTARAVTPAGAAAHYSPITRVTNDDTSTALTAALTDAGNVVFMNNAAANVFTIPANATVAFAVDTQIDIVMEGAGVTTITADTGVTLNGVSAGSGAISAQYSAVTIIKRATDTWIMFGNHAAVA